MTHEPAANIVRLVLPELAELNPASAALGQSGLEERAAMLRVLADKLRALLESDALTHIEPDFQAMMVADGLAMRAGSRPRLDDGLLTFLRRATNLSPSASRPAAQTKSVGTSKPGAPTFRSNGLPTCPGTYPRCVQSGRPPL